MSSKNLHFQLPFCNSAELDLTVAQQILRCKFDEEYYNSCPSSFLKLIQGQRGTHGFALGLYNKYSYEFLCVCLLAFKKMIDVLFPAQIHQFF